MKIKQTILAYISLQAIIMLFSCHSSAQISKILEKGLYLAGYHDVSNVDLLQESSIDSIINVAKELETSPDLDFLSDRLKFPLEDSVQQEVLDVFEEVSIKIDELLLNGKNVLVHCYAGRSRSASLVIYYLMTRKHMSLADSLELVVKSRPQIMPNIGFIEQLIDFEVKKNGSCSLDMTAYATNLVIQSNRLDLLAKIDSLDNQTSSLIKLIKDSGIFFIE